MRKIENLSDPDHFLQMLQENARMVGLGDEEGGDDEEEEEKKVELLKLDPKEVVDLSFIFDSFIDLYFFNLLATPQESSPCESQINPR